MHMSYKYLIGLMKSGLYDEYYEDLKTSMPPFMDPEVYGRSLLENVSFIATSNNPNPKNHGRGFVARLTGTTSEAITLLYLMVLGKKLFDMDQKELTFKVEPKLKKDFFDENQEVSIKLFSDIEIIIKNPTLKDTYHGVKAISYELINDEDTIIVYDHVVRGELAQAIREKTFKKVIVTLG